MVSSGSFWELSTNCLNLFRWRVMSENQQQNSLNLFGWFNNSICSYLMCLPLLLSIMVPYFWVEVLIFSNKFLGPEVIGICKRRWHSEIVGAEGECTGLSFVLFTIYSQFQVCTLRLQSRLGITFGVSVLPNSAPCFVYTCMSRGCLVMLFDQIYHANYEQFHHTKMWNCLLVHYGPTIFT